MKRETNRKTIEALLERIKRIAPHATRRVSFMVGFPGETEEDFEELYEFVEQQEFDRLGGFTFSSEEGTRAAGLDGAVPHELAMERRRIEEDLALEAMRQEFQIGQQQQENAFLRQEQELNDIARRERR
mgnify:CR=1 FL=1